MQVELRPKSFGKQLGTMLLNNAIIVGIVLIAIIVGLAKETFVSAANIRNLITNTAVRFIIAVGVSGCLITKGTDLSAGRVAGLAACVSAILLQKADYSQKIYPNMGDLPIALVVIIVLALGAIIGAVNGSVISIFKVPPFIATLGMQTLVYGICLVYTGASPIGGLRKDYTDVATSALPPLVCYGIIGAIAVALLIWFITGIIKISRASRRALIPAVLCVAGGVALTLGTSWLVARDSHMIMSYAVLGLAGTSLVVWFVKNTARMLHDKKVSVSSIVLFVLGAGLVTLAALNMMPLYSYLLVLAYALYVTKYFYDKGPEIMRAFRQVIYFLMGAAVLWLALSFMTAVFSYVAIVAYAVGFLMWFLFHKTRHGKYMYAIGGNESAAEVAGVNVTKSKIKIYMLAGMLYGLCGFLIGCRAGGASVNTAQGYELEAIAGCTIGGVSVNGGVGKISSILIGVLVFELLKIAMQFMGIESSYTYIVQGMVIIIAVALDLRKYLTKK